MVGIGEMYSSSEATSSLTVSLNSHHTLCIPLVSPCFVSHLPKLYVLHLSVVGYAGYYGLSLIVGSYPVLFVSLAAHAAQFGFLVFFENPRKR